MIRVEVVRAWPRAFESRSIELPPGATAADALHASGWQNDREVRALSVFGQRVSGDHVLEDGDRVELLRALVADPKEARRRRARDRVR